MSYSSILRPNTVSKWAELRIKIKDLYLIKREYRLMWSFIWRKTQKRVNPLPFLKTTESQIEMDLLL